MKEEVATDRLIATHGPVSTMRLLGYLWKLDTAGPEWLTEKISRQQLNHIRAAFAEAQVPFEPGAIEWPALMAKAVRLSDHARQVKATSDARKAARRPRTA